MDLVIFNKMVQLEPIDSLLSRLNKPVVVNTDDDSLDDILSNYSDHLSVTSSQSVSSSAAAAAAAIKQRSLEWKSTTFFYSPASLRRKRLNGRSEVVDQIPASPSRTETDSEQSLIPEHVRKDTSS